MREMKVDWAALHSAFQSSMPEVRCFLSLDDGQVLKMLPGDPKLAAVRCQTTRYVAVETVPSRIQYQWLDEFIATVDNEALRERFQAAANGKGAFRRFKDILLSIPEERRRWFEFRDQRMRERIVEWVREQGIMPLNEPPWAVGEGGSVPAPLPNDSRDVDALRQVMSQWATDKGAAPLPSAILDELVDEVNKRFRLRAFGGDAPQAEEGEEGEDADSRRSVG